MGNKIGFNKAVFPTKHVMCIGIDNSGKSTILLNITNIVAREAEDPAANEAITMPTVGFQLLDDFIKYMIRWRVWDFSGQGARRMELRCNTSTSIYLCLQFYERVL